MLLCAAIIKMASPGPALFVQVRVGKGGRHFRMYKLRTMHVNAERDCGAVWVQDNDPAISACRWMRGSHVDELPQLLNVIKGDMSLVGPRPERPEILKELEKEYPYIRQRLKVKPGITGLAQIRDGYDTTVEAVQHKLRSDLEYIHDRNWTMEIKILAATLTKFHDSSAK